MFTVPVSILSITNYFVAQPSAGGKYTVNFSSLFIYNEVRKKIFKISKWLLWSKGLRDPVKNNATWFLNSFEDLLKVLSEDWYRIMDLVLESNYLSVLHGTPGGMETNLIIVTARDLLSSPHTTDVHHCLYHTRC